MREIGLFAEVRTDARAQRAKAFAKMFRRRPTIAIDHDFREISVDDFVARDSRAAKSVVRALAIQMPIPGRNRDSTIASAVRSAFWPEKSIIRRRAWPSATWPSSCAITPAISSALISPCWNLR